MSVKYLFSDCKILRNLFSENICLRLRARPDAWGGVFWTKLSTDDSEKWKYRRTFNVPFFSRIKRRAAISPPILTESHYRAVPVYICRYFCLLFYFHVRTTNGTIGDRKKFEVELSKLTDSTNTGTPRKLVFSWTTVCVCVSVCLWLCVCLPVCEKKFVGYLTNKLTDLNANFGVCCNWLRIENRP